MNNIQQMLAAVARKKVSTGSTLLTNLVSWWDFDDDLTDSHGSNNLTEQGTVSYSTGNPGKQVDVDGGAGNYADISSAPAGLKTSDRDWTALIWFKADVTTGNQGIAGLTQFSPQRIDWLFRIAGATYECWVNQSGTSFKRISTRIISAGTDYMGLIWYDSAVGVKTAYMNLNNDTPSSATITSHSTAGTRLDVGMGLNETYNGKVSQLAFWDKILTSDERNELWASGAGISYSDL